MLWENVPNTAYFFQQVNKFCSSDCRLGAKHVIEKQKSQESRITAFTFKLMLAWLDDVDICVPEDFSKDACLFWH